MNNIFFKEIGIILFFILLNMPVFGESNLDQWKDSDKTYFDLIQKGFEVKAYDISNIKMQNGKVFMFFVTVLQKDKKVYECQEYQTLDINLQTLDMSVVCRELVQPYTKGLGT